MPVRIRITLLFTFVVFIILGVVCSSVYFFSYTSRINAIKTRLTNRAITTARLLSQSEIFDRQLVEQIDSLTTLALKSKTVQAYNGLNKKVYSYSEIAGDTLFVDNQLLLETRLNKEMYFTGNKKDIVSYHYAARNADIVVICGAYDEEGKRNLLRLRQILLLSFIGGLVIAIVGGYFFSVRLLLPIKKIANEVAEISAQNLTRRIKAAPVKDEWHQLSSILNNLLNRLQESFELQRRFMANASHELSTPLTSVSTQLEIALQRERSSSQYQSVLSSVLQDVKGMNKLTQTLLELANASGDKGGLNINLIRIDEVILEIPAALRKLDKKYEVFLRFDQLPENEDELLVFGNAELLFTAVKNVVVNACKYSPDHRAEVSFFIHGAYFVIEVADKGPGIPPAELSHIFQPFYRVQRGMASDGFGLGLSLTQHILKIHKGDITVQSKPGTDTLFTIRLPSARKSQF